MCSRHILEFMLNIPQNGVMLGHIRLTSFYQLSNFAKINSMNLVMLTHMTKVLDIFKTII